MKIRHDYMVYSKKTEKILEKFHILHDFLLSFSIYQFEFLLKNLMINNLYIRCEVEAQTFRRWRYLKDPDCLISTRHVTLQSTQLHISDVSSLYW